ncbi:transposase [Marinibaculum pumilum]|uniref:Transposase n=1 Tax=Marinibaculum pumilum TaxID=1766165 RepID=A0ABV7L6B1_9PROT
MPKRSRTAEKGAARGAEDRRRGAPGQAARAVLPRRGAGRQQGPGLSSLVAQGERAPGMCDRGNQWAYIYSAVRPATGDDFTLVPPGVNAGLMELFLTRFAAGLPDDVHAVLVLDIAGWRHARALHLPDNLSLVALPPKSPEFNPVERVWLPLRKRFLSLRIFPDTEAVIDACCLAWIAMSTADPGRLKSLCDCPWIAKVAS